MTRQLHPDLGVDFALSRKNQRETDAVKKERLENMVKVMNVAMHGHRAITPPAQMAIRYCPDNGELRVGHEDGKHETRLSLNVDDGVYSITPSTTETIKDNDNSSLSYEELRDAYGQSDDLNVLLGALGYLLALHYPTAAEDGRLQKVINNCKYVYGLEEPENSSNPAPDISAG